MTKEIKKIFEDKHILALDKPSGIVVNRSHTTKGFTIQDYLDNEYNITGDNEEFLKRSGLVHRIDKDTSGILLVAKESESFENLLKQFKKRKVEKEYIAVVHGAFVEEIVEVNAPIKRNPNNRFKYAVVSGGRQAKTIFLLEKCTEIEGKEYSLVRIKPITGRTHQIRVHAAALGNFVAHDEIYCTNKLLEQDKKIFNRLMLHAHMIRFKHPKTGNFVEYYSQKPGDFNI